MASKIKQLKGLKRVTSKIAEPEELKEIYCQLLFVGKNSESAALFAMLEELNVKTMTVGESHSLLMVVGLQG